MRKESAIMRTLRASIFILGFLSFADGYFKAPGMENLDTPNDHLFRGRPPTSDGWQDMPPMVEKDHTFNQHDSFNYRLPQVHSFYYKMEGLAHSMDPFEHHFWDHRDSNHQSTPFGYYNTQELNRYSEDESDSAKINAFSGEELNNPEMNRLSGTMPEAEPARSSEMTGDGEQRVVGGRDVSDGEIPWQVSLQRKSMKSGRIFHICGGSIINKEWIVTAAHCVALALLSNYRVVAATTNLRDENRIKGFNSHEHSIHKVVDVHIHDDYDMFRFRNDIALIRVEPPFEFSHKIQAIDLPSSGHQAHGMAYASGWGLTQEGVRVTPSRLQAVALPIVPDHECKQAYGDNLAETMICAGYREGGKSVCQGDSGGPLFQKHGGSGVLIGVVSWGVGCARPGKPGVYTEVAHYIGWIQDTVGGISRQNIVH